MSNAKQPYIFISYAHKDKELIYPFISALKEKYEVWFDEGIHYGREWEEEIATKLDECSIFMFAITENSLNSANCRDELSLARDNSKRFLNVMFSEDIALPGWFKLRYGRYQMCYYNRFPSARAVVEDLGQKCEWFEDVKLTTQLTWGGSYGLNSEEPNGVSFKDIIKAAEPFSEIMEEKQREINSEREKKEKSEADNSSDKRRFTREQIIEAIEYANQKEKERDDFFCKKTFKLYNDLTEQQVDSAIKVFSKFAITKDKFIAMSNCEDRRDQIAKFKFRGNHDNQTEVLITEDGVYYTDKLYGALHSEKLILSEVKSVVSLGSLIGITYRDLTEEFRDYSSYAQIVYDFLDKLTDQKPDAPTKINIV